MFFISYNRDDDDDDDKTISNLGPRDEVYVMDAVLDVVIQEDLLKQVISENQNNNQVSGNFEFALCGDHST